MGLKFAENYSPAELAVIQALNTVRDSHATLLSMVPAISTGTDLVARGTGFIEMMHARLGTLNVSELEGLGVLARLFPTSA